MSRNAGYSVCGGWQYWRVDFDRGKSIVARVPPKDGHEYDGDATVYPCCVGLKPKNDAREIEGPESDCHPGHVFGPIGGDPNSCRRETGCSGQQVGHVGG